DASSQGALGSTSHTYDDNTLGGYTVNVSVTDKDGGYDSKSFNVDVHNVAPTATFNAPSSVDEGSPISLSLTSPSDPSGADTAADQSSDEGAAHSFDLGSFTDPGADNPWTVDVTWGDGHSDSFSAGSTGTIAAHSHTYDDNGSYTVSVKVTDKDGGFDSKTFK